MLGTKIIKARPQSLRPALLCNRQLPLALRAPYFLPTSSKASPPASEPAAPLALLEAALLIADEPLSIKRLAVFLGFTGSAPVIQLIQELQNQLEKSQSSFQIEELAGGYQLLSRPEYHPWLLRLRQTANPIRLTLAARETLAIVAYRQPIMRAEIEGIRGVQCGEVLRQLMEKGFIRIVKRDESLGRPVLYGTTKKFLQIFGLKSLDELPLAEVLKLPSKNTKSSGEKTENSNHLTGEN
jgi:segregation and condensation protein B